MLDFRRGCGWLCRIPNLREPIRSDINRCILAHQGWRTSTPEEQGMDSQKLTLMLESVKQQKLNLYSLLVIRHGYIVSETYFQFYKEQTKHELYSCTKSFIATLVGIAAIKVY